MSALYAVRLANGEWWTGFRLSGPAFKHISNARDVMRWARETNEGRKLLRNARIVPVKLVEAPDA